MKEGWKVNPGETLCHALFSFGISVFPDFSGRTDAASDLARKSRRLNAGLPHFTLALQLCSSAVPLRTPLGTSSPE